MKANNNLEELLGVFGERHGFGVTGSSLEGITAWLNERIPNKQVRINVPYSNFNVRGKVADVHRDVHGVMPFTYLYGNRDEVVDADDTTTLFYGDTKAGTKNHIPFLSECDVYFIKDYTVNEDEVVINLEDAPSWRTYL